MIKAVLIDIDNTLLDFNECARQSMSRVLKERYGAEYKDEMFDTFKRINDALWLRIEKGELTRERLYEIRWNTIFNELGISIDGCEFERLFRETLHESSAAVEGAEEILKYLSEKYTVCAASNAPQLQQEQRLSRAGLLKYIRCVFTSEKAGFSKPAREFFDACFAQLDGIKPEEAVVIGDSLTADIAGGKNYGMKTLWFNFSGETARGNAADFTVNRLCDIKNCI